MPVERVRECVARSATLQGLQKPCSNAFDLYRRTRPPASTESLKRARNLPEPGPHPVLVSIAASQKLLDVSGDVGKAEITKALKRFRPAATVLEAQVMLSIEISLVYGIAIT